MRINPETTRICPWRSAVRIEIFENLMPIGLTSVSLNIERASSWTP
jgi:hypothetical protein